MRKYIIVFILIFSTTLTAQIKNYSTANAAFPGNAINQHLIILPQFYSVGYNNPVNALSAYKKTPEERKKHYILRGMLIGGAIGIAPVVFGEGGAYVAVFSFPAGLITGAILGAAAKRRHRND